MNAPVAVRTTLNLRDPFLVFLRLVERLFAMRSSPHIRVLLRQAGMENARTLCLSGSGYGRVTRGSETNVQLENFDL